jgi:hypothetical protein
MVKVVKGKKKEKRGQPPLSDLGNPPLEEKQRRKRTRPASGSRRLNPNRGCHGFIDDEHYKRYEEQLLRSDVSKINSLRLLLLYICLCLQL